MSKAHRRLIATLVTNSPDEFAAMIKAEIEKWTKVAKATEIRLM